MGIFGSIAQGAFSAKAASLNRKFQERMSSTAYQRAMADMRKGGLNPMLAYTTGGASTPSGAQASVEAPDIIGSAKKLATMRPEIKLAKEQADTVEQDRVTSKPGKQYQQLKDSIKLKGLQTGLSSAKAVHKSIVIGPEKANLMHKGYRKASKWFNKVRNRWPTNP